MAAHRRVDGVEQDAEPVGLRVRGAIRERDAAHSAELGRGGNGDDEMSEERELHGVSQPEHGEPAVGRDRVDEGSGAGCPSVYWPIAAHRGMDGVLRGPDSMECGRAGSIGVRLPSLQTKRVREGDDEDVICREQRLHGGV